MHAYPRAALAALVSFALAGCAGLQPTQNMPRNVAAAVQPVDVNVGIKQPELYAAYEISNAGQAAAAGCGAIPGIGILLAAACGGAAGAIDASVNASRAKAADETIRPLKDEIVDVQFDKAMNDAVADALKNVPGMSVASVVMTKNVDPKAYDAAFQASKSNGVMFVNVDYHISKDFSTLEISARGLLYPRSESARTAAGLPAAVPAEGQGALGLQHTAYRANVFFHLTLPVKATEPADFIAAWKADNAKLLRTGLADGTTQVARLLAEDIQRLPGTTPASLGKSEAAPGITADVVAERDGGKLFRYPDGSMHFQVTASMPANATTAAAATGGATAQ
ncbi:hypothetical protein [Ideonella sp. YS5]|uniref:hypothetical protein n=1 Tax=Ideonella sp. YS5 TaxID=3453714 RepID=UPI003EED25DC